LVKIRSIPDDYDITDLGFSAISGPIELENIDHEDWIEEKRAWFEREFPWTVQLQSALTAEGIETDYPELLTSSDDIWQFVYPGFSPQQVSILYIDSLLRTISKYGFDKSWLIANVPLTKSALNSSIVEGLFTDQEAFEQWAGSFQRLRSSQEPPDSGLLLSSLHAAVFLINTRTLAWLSLMNDDEDLPEQNKTRVLDLLQTEVNAANKLTNKAINLLWKTRQSQPCDAYPQLVGDIIENIGEIIHVEDKITKYEIGK
jgi:hypothetical protein